ncbi:MAG: uridine kinase, partial [Nocardioidaceae bacterium]
LVVAGPALVVEGVGCGALGCAPYLSLLLWVEAPTEVRMRRGLERDGEAYRPHWERWARQEQQMFAAERTRERADVLVDGDPGGTFDPETELVISEGR